MFLKTPCIICHNVLSVLTKFKVTIVGCYLKKNIKAL